MKYIISDPHLGHKQEFIWKQRGFNSIEEHDEHFIEMWNNTIKKNE